MTHGNRRTMGPIPEKVKRALLDAARDEIRHGDNSPIKFYPFNFLVGFPSIAATIAVLGSIIWLRRTDVPLIATTAIVVLLIAFFVAVEYWLRIGIERRLERYKAFYCTRGQLPLCTKCEYDLRATAAKNCPECGEAVFEFKK